MCAAVGCSDRSSRSKEAEDLIFIALSSYFALGSASLGLWFEISGQRTDRGQNGSFPTESYATHGSGQIGWDLKTGRQIPVLVNQKRVDQIQLKPMDQIEVLGCRFWYLDHCLIACASGLPSDLLIQNQRGSGMKYPQLQPFRSEMVAKASKPPLQEIGSFQLTPPGAPCVFAIESPPDSSEPKPQTMASPAGMIAISSLASAVSGFLMNPSNPASLANGLVSAGITASAFAGWYGWNAHRRKTLEKQNRITQMNDYLAYLQKKLKEIEDLRQARNDQFLKEKEVLLQVDAQSRSVLSQVHWKLPIAMVRQNFGSLDLPKIGWQMASTASRQAVDQLAALKLDCLGWQFLEQGSVLCLSHWSLAQLHWLVLFYAWQVWNESRRLAWIGFKENQIPKLPCSFLEGKTLCFEDVLDFLSCKSKYPGIEWTILSCRKLARQELGDKDTLVDLYTRPAQTDSLYCSIFPSTFPYAHKMRQASFLVQEKRDQPDVRPSCLSHQICSDQSNLLVELAPGLFWDLKQEGPHALIAGATGSGKSEGLCSILFQLAFQNKARALQYVLIDFKGGSFSTPFVSLPHTAGVLTNLTGAGIVRMEQALKMELDRRQEAVSSYLHQHPGISGEIEVCPDPVDGKPFSEIIICVDEFGQLKSRYPEFMKSLQETARIGRSLGVHLILSTQKPAGLVDEQIWANSKSRLCFPVLDAADSKEVLGHDKAAHLSKSGQFYLQCGNEIEKTGRAFYLKEPADGSSILRQFDQTEGWKEINQISLQEAMRKTILARQEKRNWLLVDDPRFTSERLTGVLEDRLNRLEPFELIPSKTYFLAGKQEAIEQAALLFAASWKEKAVLAGFSSQALPQNAPFSMNAQACFGQSLASLWQLEKSEQPILVIVKLDQNVPLMLLTRLSRLTSITLLVVCERIEFRQEKILALADYRMGCGLESRDQCALLFEGKLSSLEPAPIVHLLDQGKVRRLVLGQHYPKPILFALPQGFHRVLNQARAEELFGNSLSGLVGVEAASQKPYVLENYTLTLAWSSAAGKKPARQLAKRLQMEDPLLELSPAPASRMLCLLDLSDQLDGTALLVQACKVGDVLYFGKGLSNFAYALQISMPLDVMGSAILIRKGLTVDLQPASLIDQEDEQENR